MGHNWTNGHTRKNGPFLENWVILGKMGYTCRKLVTLGKKGHSWKWVTVGKKGYTWQIVSHFENRVTIGKMGHAWEKWVTTGKMANAWKNGSHLKKWVSFFT